MTHKFRVGQTVSLMRTTMRAAAIGEYAIRHLMPASEGNPHDPRYRIKNQAEKHERVVVESDLAPSMLHGSDFL